MRPIGTPGPSSTTKKYNFINADKEAQEIVAQGVQDFEIDKPVAIFKQEMSKSDEASVAEVILAYHKPSETDCYVITYPPWKGIPLIGPSTPKSPFLFNQDLASTVDHPKDPLIRREAMHPQIMKFSIYHELSHVKNGDCKEDSYQNNAIKSKLITIKAIKVLGGAASLLFAWKSNSTPQTKLMVATGIASISYALINNIYYYGIMAYRRHEELHADYLACNMLLGKKDPKPIVHWIIDLSFARDYTTYNGKTDNPEENIGSTHPTNLERIDLSFEELKNSGLRWNDELYEEIKKELEAEEFSAEKLVYLNQIHQSLLIWQNRNPFPLFWQKEKHKKTLSKSVAEGYIPGSEFARVVKWKKR